MEHDRSRALLILCAQSDWASAPVLDLAAIQLVLCAVPIGNWQRGVAGLELYSGGVQKE